MEESLSHISAQAAQGRNAFKPSHVLGARDVFYISCDDSSLQQTHIQGTVPACQRQGALTLVIHPHTHAN